MCTGSRSRPVLRWDINRTKTEFSFESRENAIFYKYSSEKKRGRGSEEAAEGDERGSDRV